MANEIKFLIPVFIAFILGCNIFFETPITEGIKEVGTMIGLTCVVMVIGYFIHEGRKEAAKEAIEEHLKDKSNL